MNSSLGDNKKRLGGSASSLTEMKRRSVVGQTWNFTSKQPKLPSAGYISTVEAMTASTLAYENARNAGVVPRIHLFVAVPSTSLTATVAATSFTPIQISSMVAIADSPVFTVSPALPFGLSFSSSTGTISGTPMETISETVFTVTVTANSIYPTPVSSSVTFTLAVGDSTADLTYARYDGGAASSSTPNFENPAGWGTSNPNYAALLSGTANELFYAENTPSEQNVAMYFDGFYKAPVSGSYVFTYSSDDGIELYLNGTEIINAPGATAVHTGNSTAITLVANRYYSFRGLWTNGTNTGNLVLNPVTVGGSTNVNITNPIKTRFYH